MSASHRLFPVAIVAADWSLSYPVAKSRTVCAASKFGHQSVLNYRHLHHSWETASAVHASLLKLFIWKIHIEDNGSSVS